MPAFKMTRVAGNPQLARARRLSEGICQRAVVDRTSAAERENMLQVVLRDEASK